MKLDLINRRFGRLVAIEPSHYDSITEVTFWKCRCDCGKQVIVRRTALTGGTGLQRSCGCLRSDVQRSRLTKHGKSGSAIYHIFQSMHDRCYNVKCKGYPNYGGRGIYVDESWHSFDHFYRDFGFQYKKGLSIDRIDNDGPYSLGNCRWATRRQQSANRRNVTLVEFRGEMRCLAQIFRQFGMSKNMGYHRLRSGMTLEQAVTTPWQRGRRPSGRQV